MNKIVQDVQSTIINYSQESNSITHGFGFGYNMLATSGKIPITIHDKNTKSFPFIFESYFNSTI